MTETASFHVRGAELRDVIAINQLIHDLADFEKLGHLVEATPEKLRPQLFGERPTVQALVAEDRASKEVIAFALFFTNFSTFLARPGLYLEDLYVKPANRGLGIGKALLARLAEIAVERECGRFEWSVLDWNADAIRFYESQGATLMQDWRICRVSGDALQQLGQSASAT